ncbi:hypothetical protein U1Q18_047702 [Sarracenia purpurea var. burkii]
MSCSKSEYVRCLHFACEDTLYVATNNGYLYHAKLSNIGDVKWTELVRFSEAVPIVCMDLLSGSSPNLPSTTEDWVAVGDGKGHMTIVSIIGDVCTPKIGVTSTWSAGLQRQLLGTYWCKSLGNRFIFTSDPRGILRLWRLGGPLQSVPHSSMKNCDVSLIAEFVSCFGIRIMCLDASFEEEVFGFMLPFQVLICGDLRGNLVLFPLLKDLLLGTSVASETGGDACICYLEYDRDCQNLEFLGMKQVKELSMVQYVSDSASSSDLTSGSYAIGFSSTNFLIWNLMTEAKQVVQVPCGGWRRPYSYYLGDVPEMKNCFAFVKHKLIQESPTQFCRGGDFSPFGVKLVDLLFWLRKRFVWSRRSLNLQVWLTEKLACRFYGVKLVVLISWPIMFGHGQRRDDLQIPRSSHCQNMSYSGSALWECLVPGKRVLKDILW